MTPTAEIDPARPVRRAGMTTRQAGLADIPGIVRLLPRREDLPEATRDHVEQVLRLVLTHVALEHGRLWVTCAGDEEIVAVASALPSWNLSLDDEIHDVVMREAGSPVEEIAPPEVVDNLVGALQDMGKQWIVTVLAPRADMPSSSALLAGAIAWAVEQSEQAHIPVVVIASGEQEAMDAQLLGFSEIGGGVLPAPLWLGVRHV